MYNGILYDVKDRIATITFNNPEEGNAMQFEVYQEIIAALAEADGDDNVAAVIVTGAGKNFCAGGNIRRFKRIIEDKTYIEQKSVRETVRLATAFMRCGKPVIGMINGAAAGLGMGLALACDFRIIAPSTKIVAAFINVALPGDTAIVYNLQRMVGMAEGEHGLDISEQLGVLFEQGPVLPVKLVIVAIGIVVAELRATHFVAHEDHGYALADEQHGHGVLHLTHAQGVDAGVVGRPFPAAVPTVIVVGSVAVVFAVGLVVLLVVGDEVIEREAVVGGDEVDGGRGPASGIEVG